MVPIQPICGNNIIEPSEACDDGLSNGLPGYCNTSCTSTTPVVPICGNAIIET
ncbi:TPA: hypothetical protein DCZ39_00110 [Patescibacteria group bacterium]|nr:hypothetical protein [Candidatus Gracilibacteria bacterium]